MADDWLLDSKRRDKAALIDTTVPNPARVGDYMSGGQDNFEADRRAARALAATSPVVSGVIPALRAFHQRAVRYLVAEAGIRQFLDVGTRLTMSGNTHDLAQSLAPESRIVYATSDPVVLSHARALATSSADGAVASVDADANDPRAVLAGAAETLDFGRPVAILLMATLAFVLDDEVADEIMLSLIGAVPAGSHVAIHHQASDLDPGAWAVVRRWNAMSDRQMTLRSRGELAELLDGLDPVPPGIVPIPEWRPAPGDPGFEHVIPIYGALARKPLAAIRSLGKSAVETEAFSEEGRAFGWLTNGSAAIRAGPTGRRSIPGWRTRPGRGTTSTAAATTSRSTGGPSGC